MSEIQNRAVRLLMLQQGSANIRIAEQRLRVLTAALALYRASGGSEQAARDLCSDVFSKAPVVEMANGMGDIMLSLAALSRACDLDMMQAAYNSLDRGMRELSELREQAELSRRGRDIQPL